MQGEMIADPYRSRRDNHEEIVDRRDPVVWAETGPEDGATDSTRGLDPRQLERFEQLGFHHSPQLLSESEAHELLDEARWMAESAAAADRPPSGVVMEPASDVVRSVFRVHRTNDTFRALAKDPRLVDVARQILGGEVYVHQSRINFKPPFDGKEFFWHSDFETWHVEDGMPRMRAVSVSVALTDNNEFNGPLMVVPRSHRSYVRCVGGTPENHHRQSLKKQEYGVPSRDAMLSLVDRGGITAPKGPPGSALFFDCNLMHGSSGNLSPHARTNLFIVYNSVHNAVAEPFGGMPRRPEFLSEREVVPVGSL